MTNNEKMATWERLTKATTARATAQQATRITGRSKARIIVRGWRRSDHRATAFTARTAVQTINVKTEVNLNITARLDLLRNSCGSTLLRSELEAKSGGLFVEAADEVVLVFFFVVTFTGIAVLLAVF